MTPRTLFNYSSVYRPLVDQHPGWLIQLTSELESMAAEEGLPSYVCPAIGCTLLSKSVVGERIRNRGLTPTMFGLLMRESLERTTKRSQDAVKIRTSGVGWYGNLEARKNMILGVKLSPPPANKPITREITALCGSFGDLTGSRLLPKSSIPEPHISLMIFERGVSEELEQEMTSKAAAAIPRILPLAEVCYE